VKLKIIAFDQKGAAAVECALMTFFILVPLFLAIMDFGIAFYNKQIIINASREGARAAIAPTDATVTELAIEQVINDYCFRDSGDSKKSRLISFGGSISEIPSDDIDVKWNGDTATPAVLNFRDTVSVSVSFVYKSLFYGNMGLDAVTKMRGQG